MNINLYNKILHASRRKEIALNKTALKSVISLLTAISNDLDAMILQFAGDDGKLRREQLQSMKDRIEEDLDIFKDQYEDILNQGVSETTNLIINRNGEIFIRAEGTTKLIGLLNDSILKRVVELKEKDGLILSDRIWRLGEEAKIDITNRLQKGLLLGESHSKVAKDIRNYVKGGALKYKSERLVTTEMAKAYKIANEMSVEQMRQNSQYMWFEKWELSPAHPRPDVCWGGGTLVETKNGPKKIEDINIGDEVLTHEGRYRKVMKLYRSQVQNDTLRKLTFQSEKNRILSGVSTPNHPILTGEGWIPAGDLKKGCSVVCLSESLLKHYSQQ